MKYNPYLSKQKFQTFYTSGKELMLIDGTEYIGYYHLYFNNKYTDKLHSETSYKLIPYTNDKNVINYINIKKLNTSMGIRKSRLNLQDASKELHFLKIHIYDAEYCHFLL